MDKNSITGMLLMAAVVFLFMYFNKPSQEQIDAQRRAQQEQTQQSQQPANLNDQSSVPVADPATLTDFVRKYGVGDSLSTKVANLHLVHVNDSTTTIAGTITSDGNTYDVNDIISGNIPEASTDQVNRARTALNQMILKFQRYESFAPYFDGDEQTVVLGNDSTNMRVTFSTRGAAVSEVVLNRFKNERVDSAAKVTLFTPQTGKYSFEIFTERQRLNTDSLNFKLIARTDTSVVMGLKMHGGAELQMRYTIDQQYYMVRMELLQNNIGQVIPPNTTSIDYMWQQHMVRNEVGNTFENRNSCITYKCYNETPDELSASKDDSETINGNVKWVAFKNQFFSSVIIPDNSFTNVRLESKAQEKNPVYCKEMSMSGTIPYSINNPVAFAADFYFGPNDYPLLSKIDKMLEREDADGMYLNRLVPLGWGIFGWINKWLVIPVFSFLSSFIHNYGIIILLLTIFIKIILFPFTYKSYVSQAKMKLLAPEISEINEKYPDQKDAMKRQQETMALYSRAGASPFSGCLPMLLQMPVLIAMFAFFPSAIELRGQSFLWAHDLSAPDYILKLPFTIPWYGDHVSLFCLLMTATNIIYTRVTMQSQPSNPQMPSMKWMMYLMPVMFLFFFNDYASALSYYYFLSLLITIVQTYVIRHYIIDENKMRQQMAENAKKPKKKSGFMARLEAAQRQQEAMMREQSKRNARRR